MEFPALALPVATMVDPAPPVAVVCWLATFSCANALAARADTIRIMAFIVGPVVVKICTEKLNVH